MIIRDYRPEDLEQVASIFEQEITKTPYAEYAGKKYNQQDVLESVDEWTKTGTILVAEEQKEILGVIVGETFKFMSSRRLWISEFYTKVQGQGIGTKLLNEIIAKFKGIVSRIELNTHIDAKAMDFYKKHGFEHKGYVLMEKKL